MLKRPSAVVIGLVVMNSTVPGRERESSERVSGW